MRDDLLCLFWKIFKKPVVDRAVVEGQKRKRRGGVF